jgi:hypothetical protein
MSGMILMLSFGYLLRKACRSCFLFLNEAGHTVSTLAASVD